MSGIKMETLQCAAHEAHRWSLEANLPIEFRLTHLLENLGEPEGIDQVLDGCAVVAPEPQQGLDESAAGSQFDTDI